MIHLADHLSPHRVIDLTSRTKDAALMELVETFAGSEEVASALSGRGVSVLRRRTLDQPPPPLTSISRGATVRVFVTTPVVLDERVVGAVLLSRTPPTIEEVLHAERLELVGLAVALLGVVLAVALVTSLTITRPVRALIERSHVAHIETALELYQIRHGEYPEKLDELVTRGYLPADVARSFEVVEYERRDHAHVLRVKAAK